MGVGRSHIGNGRTLIDAEMCGADAAPAQAAGCSDYIPAGRFAASSGH